MGARLLALSLVFCIPIALLTGLFIAQSWKDISFANREIDGASYEKAIWPVLRASALGAGVGADQADLRAVRGRFDAEFGTAAATDALARAASAAQRLEAGRALMDTVADRSNLTLDPDLDSFYVMDAVTVRLPTLLVSTNTLSEAAALPASVSDRPVRIAEALQTLRGAADAATSDFDAAMRANATGKARAALAGHAAALQRFADVLADQRDALIAGAPGATADADVRALQAEVGDTWRVARDELQRLLEARVGRLTQTLILNLAVVLYFLGFAAALAFIIAGGLSRRVADLIIAMDRLIDGDIRVAVPHLADRNETGHIARTVEAFKQSLIEGERLREEAQAQTASAETARATAEAERARVVRFLSVGEMASSIAHEINQPIAAIVAGGAAARRWLERETPNVARARQAIDRIVRDAGRAGAVIARIRQVLGKNAPIFLRIDVNQAVQEALEFTERERSLARIATRLDLAPGLPPVRGDRVQLQQVIINLTLNGVDAMKSTQGAPRTLSVATALTPEGEVLVSVADSGEGLEPGAAERLFDPFYTTKQTGMGLGLSISRSIIADHGGKIWAETGADGGAVFRFTLPVWGDGRYTAHMSAAG